MRSTHRRGRVLGALSSFAIAALLLAGCTGGDSVPSPDRISNPMPDDAVEQMQAATERAIAAGGGPGAIVGVWAPWAGEWEAGIGETEPGSGTAPSTDMTFRAATVTRSMTCDLLYAMDGGPVNLDDAVSTYLQSVPQLTDVTLVDLCNGVAGLRSSRDPNWNFVIGNTDRVWDPREYAAAGLGAGLRVDRQLGRLRHIVLPAGARAAERLALVAAGAVQRVHFRPPGPRRHLPALGRAVDGRVEPAARVLLVVAGAAERLHGGARRRDRDLGLVRIRRQRRRLERHRRARLHVAPGPKRGQQRRPAAALGRDVPGQLRRRAVGARGRRQSPQRIHARPAGRHPRLQRCGVQRRRHGADAWWSC